LLVTQKPEAFENAALQRQGETGEPVKLAPAIPYSVDWGAENFNPDGNASEVLNRKGQLYQLPAIITPRRDAKGRHLTDAGVS